MSTSGLPATWALLRLPDRRSASNARMILWTCIFPPTPRLARQLLFDDMFSQSHALGLVMMRGKG
jgi:hypothetical protein